MSKAKNVHPDHYKTRGSLRQGEEVVQEEHRERFTRGKSALERKARAPRKTEPPEPEKTQNRAPEPGEGKPRKKKNPKSKEGGT